MTTQGGDLRETLNNYTPGHTVGSSSYKCNRVGIQLFGLLGHGKSALTNTCISVLKDQDYENVADSGMSEGGRTKERNHYDLTKKLFMIDNRGFSKLNDLEMLEALAQLRSLREVDKVEWDKDNLELTLGLFPTKYRKFSEELILPVLVFSAACNMSRDMEEYFEAFIKHSYHITGIHPVIVITNINYPEAKNKLKHLEKTFGDMGARHRVFLENYTENNYTRTPKKDQEVLALLSLCTREAERCLGMRKDQDSQKRFFIQGIEQIKLEIKTAQNQEQEKQKKLEDENKKLKEKCRLS